MSSLTNHTQAQVLAKLMIDDGLGTDPSTDPTVSQASLWPIYVNYEPERPDNVMTVYDTEGLIDTRRKLPVLSGSRWEAHGWQVRLRAAKPSVGTPKINSVYNAFNEDFDRYTNATVTIDSNTYRVHNVRVTSPVVNLRRQDRPHSNRSLYTINGYILITPA